MDGCQGDGAPLNTKVLQTDTEADNPVALACKDDEPNAPIISGQALRWAIDAQRKNPRHSRRT